MSEQGDKEQQIPIPQRSVNRRGFLKGFAAGAGTAALAAVLGSDRQKTETRAHQVDTQAGQETILESSIAVKVVKQAHKTAREFINKKITIPQEPDLSKPGNNDFQTFVKEHITQGNREFLYRLNVGPDGTQKIGVLLNYPSDLHTAEPPKFSRYNIAISSIDPQIMPNISEAFDGDKIKEDSLKTVAENIYNLPGDVNLTWVKAQTPKEQGSTPALRAIGATPQGRIFELYINTFGASELTVTEPTNVPEHINPD